MKNKVVKVSLVLAMFILLLGVATLFDLSIAKAFASANLDIIVTIGSLGKLPAYLGLVFGFMCVYSGVEFRFKKIWFIWCLKIATAVCVFVSFGLTIDYVFNIGLVVSMIIALPFSVVAVCLVEKFKNKFNALFYFGIMLIGVVVLSAVLIEGLKLIWCRERPYMLIEANDYSSFTSWFRPMLFTDTRTSEYLVSRGIESSEWWGLDGFMSMPSGHAGMVATIFAICYLPKFVSINKKYSWVLYTLSILLTVFVCFSRVVGLMHYLSDVVMGVAITLISLVFVYFITMIIKKHMFKE